MTSARVACINTIIGHLAFYKLGDEGKSRRISKWIPRQSEHQKSPNPDNDGNTVIQVATDNPDHNLDHAVLVNGVLQLKEGQAPPLPVQRSAP